MSKNYDINDPRFEHKWRNYDTPKNDNFDINDPRFEEKWRNNNLPDVPSDEELEESKEAMTALQNGTQIDKSEDETSESSNFDWDQASDIVDDSLSWIERGSNLFFQFKNEGADVDAGGTDVIVDGGDKPMNASQKRTWYIVGGVVLIAVIAGIVYLNKNSK